MSQITDAIDSLSSDTTVRIDPTVVPVELSADEVHFRAGPWAGPIITLRDEGRDGTLASVVAHLDMGTTIGEIMNRVEGVNELDVRHILSELDRKNVLRKMNGDSVVDPMPLPLRFAQSDLKTLKSTEVLVMSSGEIGPLIVEMLASAGVGNVFVNHRRDDGTSGTFDGATTVQAWDESEPQINDRVEEVDLCISATMQPCPGASTLVNKLALKAGTPSVYANVTGYDITIGPTVLPGETACFECYNKHRTGNMSSGDGYEAFEQVAKNRTGTVTDCLPFAEIAAGFLATDIINFLCYGHGFTVGSIVTFDMSNLSMESNDVLKFPRCDICGELNDTLGRDALFTIHNLTNNENQN